MSQKLKAAITSVGGYVPETKLTNFDLEKLVDTNDEWIKSRTGISERRILREPGKASSDMAAKAVEEILRKKNLDPLEIDCIICATVTPDMVFPATANIIGDKIGAKKSYISRVENGKSDIQLSTLFRLFEFGLGKRINIVIE